MKAARVSRLGPDAAFPAAAEDLPADSDAGSPSAADPADVLDRLSRSPSAALRNLAAVAAELPGGIAIGSVASPPRRAPTELADELPAKDSRRTHFDSPDCPLQGLHPLHHVQPHLSVAGSQAPRLFGKQARAAPLEQEPPERLCRRSSCAAASPTGAAPPAHSPPCPRLRVYPGAPPAFQPQSSPA